MCNTGPTRGGVGPSSDGIAICVNDPALSSVLILAVEFSGLPSVAVSMLQCREMLLCCGSSCPTGLASGVLALLSCEKRGTSGEAASDLGSCSEISFSNSSRTARCSCVGPTCTSEARVLASYDETSRSSSDRVWSSTSAAGGAAGVLVLVGVPDVLVVLVEEAGVGSAVAGEEAPVLASGDEESGSSSGRVGSSTGVDGMAVGAPVLVAVAGVPVLVEGAGPVSVAAGGEVAPGEDTGCPTGMGGACAACRAACRWCHWVWFASPCRDGKEELQSSHLCLGRPSAGACAGKPARQACWRGRALRICSQTLQTLCTWRMRAPQSDSRFRWRFWRRDVQLTVV
ncbi:hypothetical protein HPB50_011519 [Hyalomma asiaticum]|uniref:Uncharacterized protein n=1 Tax=Hyalomma asiaticum TaxID=266040 RepID=A0ACB7TDF4_HYAAI|nr:hypothetical protein HPB50_011519 [Hyalomma asiaticum]